MNLKCTNLAFSSAAAKAAASASAASASALALASASVSALAFARASASACSASSLKQVFNVYVQVNLRQKHLFLDQLTHNMTKDCSLIS